MIKAGKNCNNNLGKQIFQLIIQTIINFIEANILKKDSTYSENKKQLLMIKAIRKKWEDNENLFNESPKKFLKQYAQEYFLDLSEDEKAENFAIFLRVSQRIQTKKMIEILGSPDKLNMLILKKYIETFNFENIDLLFAIRVLFSNFLMFGEAQMIERVLEEFVKHYQKSNTVKKFIFIFKKIRLFLNQVMHYIHSHTQ